VEDVILINRKGGKEKRGIEIEKTGEEGLRSSLDAVV